MYICRFLRVQLLSEWNHCNEHCWCVVHLYQLIVTWLDITLQRVTEMYLCFFTYLCFSVYPCIFSVYLCSLFRSLCFESVKPHKTLTWLFLLRYSKVCTTSAVSRYDTIRYIYHLTLCYQSLYVCLCVCVCLCCFIRWTLWQNVRPSVGCWLSWDVSHSVQVIDSRCCGCCFCRLMLFVILTYFFSGS